MASAGVRAWEAFLRAHAAAVAQIERDLLRRTGTPLAWYDVLLELHHAPGRRLRMSVLGDAVTLSRSRVSRVVDELERAELVTRAPDPDDGRATLAAITPAGSGRLRVAAPVYLELIDEHFARHLTGREATAIHIALGKVYRAGAASAASHARSQSSTRARQRNAMSASRASR